MNLPPQQTIALLRLIRKHQLLWNPKHPNYGDKVRQLVIWNKISTYLKSDNGKAAFNVYRKLRRNYTTTLAKILEGRFNEPLPYYFNEFNFLKPIIERELITKSSNYLRDCKQLWSRSIRPINVRENDLITDNEPDEHLDEQLLYGVVSSQGHQNVPEPSENTAQSRSELNPSSSSTANVQLTSSNDDLSQNSISYTKLNESEFETFGSYIVTQLRQLDSISTMELMTDIQSLISKKRIQYLKNHRRQKIHLNDSQT